MTVPEDVLVKRQVLAEPDGTLQRAHLGGARRRHAAGHRATVGQGLAGPLPRHRRYQLVESSAFGHLRRDAAAGSSPSRPRREAGAGPAARRPAGAALSPARRLRPLHHARPRRRADRRPMSTNVAADAAAPARPLRQRGAASARSTSSATRRGSAPSTSPFRRAPTSRPIRPRHRR